MKKGISSWCFSGGSYAEKFALAKQTGFDGVELALNEAGELSLDSTRQEVEAIAALAKETGLELYSLATTLQFNYPLTVNDPAMRERTVEMTKKQIEVASWLGCNTVLVVPGVVNAEVSYAIAYERSLAAIKELAQCAADHGVYIGVENVWNKFLLSPLEMRDFIDAAGSEWVGSYFDVGNVLNWGYPDHWIEVLGSRIKKVHIKDFRSDIGNIFGFCDLLTGHVDFPAAMEALNKVGYDGWITAEMNLYPNVDDKMLLERTSMAMDKILGR